MILRQIVPKFILPSARRGISEYINFFNFIFSSTKFVAYRNLIALSNHLISCLSNQLQVEADQAILA